MKEVLIYFPFGDEYRKKEFVNATSMAQQPNGHES